ncbi:sugar porter family MFS transporter [Sphingomonas sp.]|uniref:sugar porter family MFS transporter n=1 Tax=Sphingomonas sp. TaxID=28214 RepID=UPI0025E00967|nr:sugar porter family MFS transporter [Sphingomonas sp.]
MTPVAARQAVTRGLIASIACAALAGLLFGFDTAVISGTTTALSREFRLDATWLGVTVSAALWGTLLGSLAAGRPGDRFGARDALKGVGLLFLVGALGSALATGWGVLVFFRILTGLAVGGASVLAPVYIAEIAPARHRGAMVVVFQLNIILGILIAFISNAVIGAIDLGPDDWRWKFGVGAAPALLLLAMLFRISQSPRWLVGRDRADEAAAALIRTGRTREDAIREIAEIRASLASEPVGERLRWSAHARPILLAILIALFNQLSGINALLYYINDIFVAAGAGGSADAQAIVIGLANGVFTCLGLVLIDRAGRRTLLAVGSIGMAGCLTVAGLALDGVLPKGAVLFALIGFIACFASSTGAVIWVYLSEIFPTAVRNRGAALGASVHWGANAVIAAAFPWIAARSAGLPFLFFAAMMALQCVIVLRFFPETKRASLEQLQRKEALHG